jgi:(2Fe-2S) ferredoxin
MTHDPRKAARLPPMMRVAPGESEPEPAQDERTVVFVCHGPSCSERGSVTLCAELRRLVASRDDVRICETSCLDHCAMGPNVVLGASTAIQHGVGPDRAEDFVRLVTGEAG